MERPGSPYFRYGTPGVVTARPAAIAPSTPAGRFAARTRRFLFGRPLASEEEVDERLSKLKALATFSSDNLSSVAYATEAIMFTLLAAGAGASTRELMARLGHASSAASLRYQHATASRDESIAERLSELAADGRNGRHAT